MPFPSSKLLGEESCVRLILIAFIGDCYVRWFFHWFFHRCW